MTNPTTREDDSTPGTTREEIPGTTREDSAGGNSASAQESVLLRLPQALASRFALERQLDTQGNEADLLVVRERTTSQQLVVKLYRRGIAPKKEIMDILHSLNTDHVVRQLEHGVSENYAYEVMEYASDGSLANMLSAGMNLAQVWEAIRQISAALNYLHRLTPPIVHRDIKPDNILLRSVQPLKLVLADFSFASQIVAGSRVATTRHRTVFYAAPEASAGDISPAADWWALGMTVAEAVGCKHPFAGCAEEAVAIHLINRNEIPLDLVTDPRMKLLCKGLLCYDQKRRWGMPEVERWLKGDSTLTPPVDTGYVPAAGTSSTASSGPRAANPYRIADMECWTLLELAEGFRLNWSEGIKRMSRRTDIERWLLHELKDQNAYNQFMDLHDGNMLRGTEADTKLSVWLAMLNPKNPPYLHGSEITPEIFLNLLQSTNGDDNAWPEALDEPYGRMLARLSGAAWLSEKYDQFNQAQAEAEDLDTKLRVKATNMNPLPSGRELELLMLVHLPAYRNEMQNRIEHFLHSAEVRSCRRYRATFSNIVLTPGRLWVLLHRMGEIRSFGAADLEVSRSSQLKIGVGSAFAVLLMLLVGLQYYNKSLLSSRTRTSFGGTSAASPTKGTPDLNAHAKEMFQTGANSNFLRVPGTNSINGVSLQNLHPAFMVGAAARLFNVANDCQASLTVTTTSSTCIIGNGRTHLSITNNLLPEAQQERKRQAEGTSISPGGDLFGMQSTPAPARKPDVLAERMAHNITFEYYSYDRHYTDSVKGDMIAMLVHLTGNAQAAQTISRGMLVAQRGSRVYLGNFAERYNGSIAANRSTGFTTCQVTYLRERTHTGRKSILDPGAQFQLSCIAAQ